MKTYGLTDVIKAMELSIINYNFIKKDMFINQYGVNKEFSNKSIFKGYELIIILNTNGIDVYLIKDNTCIFSDFLGISVIKMYFLEGFSLSILIDLSIEIIEEELGIERIAK